MRRFLSGRIALRAVIAMLFLFVSGCNVNPSRKDVIGTYVLKGQRGK